MSKYKAIETWRKNGSNITYRQNMELGMMYQTEEEKSLLRIYRKLSETGKDLAFDAFMELLCEHKKPPVAPNNILYLGG